MTATLTVHLPRPHGAQISIMRESKRYSVVDCGRRFGKSTLGQNRLVAGALAGQPVAWFSPTYKMLSEVWRDVRTITAPVTSEVNAQERRIRLVTGGSIDFWSLDTSDVARGRKYGRVIIDEAAMIADLEHAWQAVLRPTLTDLRGDAWFLSTPKGRNYFWQLFQRGQDPEQTDWCSWQMPTTANPYISPEEVEAARGDMPERTFSQEYLAAFLEDAGGVFRRVNDAATLPGLATPDPSHPRQTVMGVDWGRSYDFTVLCVVDVRTHELVDMDRFNQIDWPFQRARLKAMWSKWRCTSILVESNSIGDPNLSELRRENLPVQGFQTTNATKAQIIETLALAIETGALRYPKIPELLGELLAYEQERLPSGLIRYGAPQGAHDDIVMGLALANWAATSSRPMTAAVGGTRDVMAGYRAG